MGAGCREGLMSALSFSAVGESDQARVFATLVLAFAADPVERWLYPEPQQYLSHFPRFLAAFGGRAFAERTVWSLGEFCAVALWLPPGTEADGDAITTLLTETVAADKHDDTFAVLGQMETAHPGYPHWPRPGITPAARPGRSQPQTSTDRCADWPEANLGEHHCGPLHGGEVVGGRRPDAAESHQDDDHAGRRQHRTGAHEPDSVPHRAWKIHAGMIHAGKTATVICENNHFRVVIDGGVAAVVPPPTISEVHRYKVNATDKRTQAPASDPAGDVDRVDGRGDVEMGAVLAESTSARFRPFEIPAERVGGAGVRDVQL